MNIYEITFEGRQRGTIGITISMTTQVQAKTPDEALSVLYKNYELIKCPKIKEIERR